MGPDASLTPELIQAQSFTSTFRGFDQSEVRSFLNRVATEMRAWRERAEQLESAWHAAEERAARPPVLDEDTLMAAVGEETASILRSARAAAADMRSKAAEESERQLAEAREEGERLLAAARSEADRLTQESRSDAEKERSDAHEQSEKLLTEARTEADRLLTEARSEADRLRTAAEDAAARTAAGAEDAAARLMSGARSEAAEIMEKSRTEAEAVRAAAEKDRQLTIEGATTTRDRILEDLSRRRRIATVQIEQLRAGRERLIESYAVVRRTLEEVSSELSRADAEARAAADDVGRRLAEDPDALLHGPAGTEAPEPALTVLDGGPAGEEAAEGDGPAEGAAVDAAPEAADAAPEAAVPGGEHEEAPQEQGERGEQEESGQDGSADQSAEQTADQSAEQTADESAEQTADESAEQTADESAEQTADQLGGEGPAGADNPPAKPKRSRSRAKQATTEPPLQQPAEPAVEADADGDAGADSGSAVDELFARIRGTRHDAEAAAGDQPRPAAEDEAAGDEPDDEPGEAGRAASHDADRAASDDADEAEDEEDGERLSDADESLLQRRESAVVDLEVTLTRRLKRALQDEQNDVLDRLRNLKGEPTAERLLAGVDEQTARYRDAARPLLVQAVAAGSEFAAEALGPGTATSSGEGAGIDDLAEETGTGIVGPLRRRLEQAMERNAGEDQAVLIESLGAAYREWKTQRIERLAGDMLAAAFSRGTWEAAPEGAVLRWIVEDTDGPCPDCDDDALAGDLPKGEAFPTGQHHPPAHSGCRCLLVPGPPAV